MLSCCRSFGFIFFCIFCIYSFAWCCEEADKVEHCGDGVLDEGEDCDLDSVPDNCYTVDPHYNGGTLRCNNDCTYNRMDCI